MKLAITVATLIFALCSLLAICNIFKLGKSGYLFDLLVHFTPHPAGFGIILSALLALRSEWALFGLATLASLPHLWAIASFDDFMEAHGNTPNGTASLTVISSNVWGKDSALLELAQIAAREEADVVAISEMSQKDSGELALIFPGFSFRKVLNTDIEGKPLSKSMALMSRREPQTLIIHSDPAYHGRLILDAQFLVGSAPLQLVVVHPVAPGSPQRTISRDMVLQFASDLVEGNQSFAIVGDMNTTPWSRISRQLAGRRAGDPRRESTWISKWPLIGLPIDHVRIGQNVKLNAYEVGPFIGSDHRPLLAILSVAD